MKHVAESSVRRLSLYLRYLEEFDARAQATISSGELARLGGTTSAQVRKDLSTFGSFGKRGLGYNVKELIGAIREILGLDQSVAVLIIGAGKIGAALAQYRGFSSRGFRVVGVYDRDPARIGHRLDGLTIRAETELERDIGVIRAEAFALHRASTTVTLHAGVMAPHQVERDASVRQVVRQPRVVGAGEHCRVEPGQRRLGITPGHGDQRA